MIDAVHYVAISDLWRWKVIDMQNATSAFLQGTSGTELAPNNLPEASDPSINVEHAIMAAVNDENVNDINAVSEATGLPIAEVEPAVGRLVQEGLIEDLAGLSQTEAGKRFVEVSDLIK